MSIACPTTRGYSACNPAIIAVKNSVSPSIPAYMRTCSRQNRRK